MSITVRGDSISVGNGSAQLRCTVSYTTSAIKFKPYVVVTSALDKIYPCEVSWVLPAAQVSADKTLKTTKQTYTRNVQAAGTYYIPEDNKWQTNRDYSVKVTAKIEGKTSVCTLTSDTKPSAPSIKATRKNDNHYTVTVKGKAKGAAVPTNTLTIQRQTDVSSASWSSFATKSPNTTGSYSYDIPDQTTDRAHRYRWRVRSTNQAGNSSWVTTSWYYTNPPQLSNVTHERLSNAKHKVTWTWDLQALDRSLITGVLIQRSTNGGSWTKAVKATVKQTTASGAGNAEQGVWTDTGRSVDKTYSYRIKPYNPSVDPSIYESPSSSGTALTYNTPAAPSSVKAVYTSSGNVKLTIKTAAHTTATGMIIQRSNDGGSTWSTVNTPTSVLSTWTDTAVPTGGTLVYRVASTRTSLPSGSQNSPYKNSNTVTALSQPSAPTLISPVNGEAFTLSAETVRLVWVHNPTDGTPQESATVQYRLSGASSWTTVTTTESYYDLSIGSFAANDVIEWRVSTKGAFTTASDYSGTSNFVIYAAPSVTFSEPDNGSVITNLPLDLAFDYSDESGTLAALTLSILKGDETVYTEELDVDAPYEYTLDGFIFDNDTSYQLLVTAQSTTGLESTDAIGVTVGYVPVRLTNGLLPDVILDGQTGMATISLALDESPNETADPDADEPIVVNSTVSSAYLYRVVNGQRTLLASGLNEGDQVIDMYAPLNAVFTYELLMVAASGQILLVQVDEYLESTYFFCYFGGDMARALWNPSGSVDLSRPEKVQIRYSGRTYPVTYDSKAIGQTFNLSFAITERNELDAFIRLMESGGQGVWKSADGDVYAADFAFSYSSEYSNNTIVWQASLATTRIDGGDL